MDKTYAFVFIRHVADVSDGQAVYLRRKAGEAAWPDCEEQLEVFTPMQGQRERVEILSLCDKRINGDARSLYACAHIALAAEVRQV